MILNIILCAAIASLAAGWAWDRKRLGLKVASESDRAEHWKNMCSEMETFVKEAKPLHDGAKSAMSKMREGMGIIQNDVDALRRRMNAYKIAWETMISTIPADKQQIAKKNMEKFLATLPRARDNFEVPNVIAEA